MKYHKFTAAEKAAYRAGKIRAYYQNKSRCKKTAQKPKFVHYDVNDAFARALERSYGKEESERYLKSSK